MKYKLYYENHFIAEFNNIELVYDYIDLNKLILQNCYVKAV